MWANINTAYFDLLETDREDGGCAASHGYSFTECVEVTSHQPAASHLAPEVPGNTERLQDSMVPALLSAGLPLSSSQDLSQSVILLFLFLQDHQSDVPS